MRLAILKALVTAALDLLSLGKIALGRLHSLQSGQLVQARALRSCPGQGGQIY